MSKRCSKCLFSIGLSTTKNQEYLQCKNDQRARFPRRFEDGRAIVLSGDTCKAFQPMGAAK